MVDGIVVILGKSAVVVAVIAVFAMDAGSSLPDFVLDAFHQEQDASTWVLFLVACFVMLTLKPRQPPPPPATPPPGKYKTMGPMIDRMNGQEPPPYIMLKDGGGGGGVMYGPGGIIDVPVRSEPVYLKAQPPATAAPEGAPAMPSAPTSSGELSGSFLHDTLSTGSAAAILKHLTTAETARTCFVVPPKGSSAEKNADDAKWRATCVASSNEHAFLGIVPERCPHAEGWKAHFWARMHRESEGFKSARLAHARTELAAKHPEITAAAAERLRLVATLPRTSPAVQAYYLPRNEMCYLAEETREELEAEEPRPRYSAQGAMVPPEPGTACGTQGLHTLLLQGKVAGIDALQTCVINGSLLAVEYLLASGVDPNAVYRSDSSTLDLTMQRPELERRWGCSDAELAKTATAPYDRAAIGELLTRHGAVSMSAVRDGKLRALDERLSTYVAAVEAATAERETLRAELDADQLTKMDEALFLAAATGDAKAVFDLLVLGASPLHTANYAEGTWYYSTGHTALFCACRNGFAEPCRLLLAAGAEVNATNTDGYYGGGWR